MGKLSTTLSAFDNIHRFITKTIENLKRLSQLNVSLCECGPHSFEFLINTLLFVWPSLISLLSS